MSAVTTLRRGSLGEQAERLQAALRAKGFSPGPADGDFGPMTDQAVRRFQRAQGLEVDGIVGPTPGRHWKRGRGPQATG